MVEHWLRPVSEHGGILAVARERSAGAWAEAGKGARKSEARQRASHRQILMKVLLRPRRRAGIDPTLRSTMRLVKPQKAKLLENTLPCETVKQHGTQTCRCRNRKHV